MTADLSLRATTRNPVVVWHWIPDRVRDDKCEVRDDKCEVRDDECEVRDDKSKLQSGFGR